MKVLKKSPGYCGSVGWSILLYTERSWVWSLVRAYARVVGLIPGHGAYRGHQSLLLSHVDVSLSPPLPHSL